jgi:4-amino-4-deoxy-L-arabinose transferase-like glycosyltransferase
MAEGLRAKGQGPREKTQGSRPKAQEFRPLSFVLGPWSLVLGPWSLPLGIWDLGFGIFFLLLYTLTLSHTFLPADAGEFQLVGATLGVAHPPGFALYTLLAWLISRVPFVAPATAINFLSALLAVVTLILLSRVVRRLTDSPWAGLFAALALGFSTTFWAQAITANIRMLTAFAVALMLDRLLAYRAGHPERNEVKSKDNPRNLALVAFALGLGVSHHASLIFIALVLGLYVLWLNPTTLRRPWPLLLGLAPFLAWVYFPLRAGAPNAPPQLTTLNGFLEHVLARGFQGDLFHFAHLKDLPERFLIFSDILAFEFNWPLLILTALGGAAALWRDRQFGILLLAAFVVHSFVAITYSAPQTVEYLLPSYLFMALALGFAFAEISHLPRLINSHPFTPSPPHLVNLPSSVLRLSSFVFPLLFLLPQLLSTFPSYLTLSHDTSTRDYAESILTDAPPNALILSSWHWATPLWYLQRVEGQRPDVEVRYVFPRSISLAQDWANEISAALPTRPVVVTSFYPNEYGALPYRFIPLGPAWEVLSSPLTQPPANLVGSETFADWTFLGYHLNATSPDPSIAPAVDLVAAWQTLHTPQDINFFIHLLNAEGQLYGQMDISHPADRYLSGEVLLDRYTITLRPDAPPGDYTLVAGAYLPDGTRLAETQLTALKIAARSTPPVTMHPLYRNISGATLIGYDIDHTIPESPHLYLHWKLGRTATSIPLLGSSLSLPASPGYLTTAHDSTSDSWLLTPDFILRPSSFVVRPPSTVTYIPFGNILLTGFELSPPGPLHPGQTLKVTLHFLAAQPLVEDDMVKVGLIGPNYTWNVQSNSIPAGGSIPTLKWIKGSRVTDRHTLTIPPNATPGSAQLILALYDSFTQRDLPILDPRLTTFGSAIPLGTVEIVE